VLTGAHSIQVLLGVNSFVTIL